MNALVILFPQRDFAPGGALPIPGCEALGPLLNKLVPQFSMAIALRKMHPINHVAFAANHEGRSPGDIIDYQGLEFGLLPVHCVCETPGAEYLPGLQASRIHQHLHTGTNAQRPARSGFFEAGHEYPTPLGELLTSWGCEEVTVTGVGTDEAILLTVEDGIKMGFVMTVASDACCCLNRLPGAGERALAKMKRLGATITTSTAITGESPTS